MLPTRTAGRLGLATLVLAICAGTAAATTPDFFPRSSFDYIQPSELGQLDCWGLWHARNEIYARGEYRFKTAKAQAEFGTDGFVDNPELGQVEMANVMLIKQFEKAAYCS